MRYSFGGFLFFCSLTLGEDIERQSGGRMKAINENRLFGLLHHFFSKPSLVFTELVQNAQRAGATEVFIDVDDEKGILKYKDNGKGVTDPKVMLVLADSGWEKEIQRNQEPAGWGLFVLYAIADSVRITSKFGTLMLDCSRYMTDSEYRKRVLTRPEILSDPKSNGLVLEANLKNNVKIDHAPYGLHFAKIDVWFNGEKIRRKTIDALIEEGINTAEFEYEGNRVKVDLYGFSRCQHVLRGRIFMDMYGIPVGDIASPAVAIEVRRGKPPLTPLLPTREGIVDDDRYRGFLEWLKKQVVEYCIELINSDSDGGQTIYQETVQNIGSREDLNRLQKFNIEMTDSHYSEDPVYESTWRETVTRKNGGTTVFSRSVSFVKVKWPDGKTERLVVGDETSDFIHLPRRTVCSVAVNVEKIPDWIKIVHRRPFLTVEAEKVDHMPPLSWRNNAVWIKGKIELIDGKERKNLKAAILFHEETDTEYFFYAESPEDIYEVYVSYFNAHRYSDDGDLYDTYDTQLQFFEEDIEKSIRKLSNRVNIRDLLDEIAGILDISPTEVKSIRVDIESKTGTVITAGGSTSFLLSTGL